MSLQIVFPAVIDGMPKEVATEYLASPKAKLTNRFRKTCAAARQTVFESNLPLRRPDPDGPRFFDNAAQPKTPEAKLARKFAGLPLAKLGVIYRRAITRRRTIQRLYEKLLPDNSKQAVQLRVLLASRAATFDMLSEAAHDEIRWREMNRRAEGTKP